MNVYQPAQYQSWLQARNYDIKAVTLFQLPGIVIPASQWARDALWIWQIKYFSHFSGVQMSTPLALNDVGPALSEQCFPATVIFPVAPQIRLGISPENSHKALLWNNLLPSYQVSLAGQLQMWVWVSPGRLSSDNGDVLLKSYYCLARFHKEKSKRNCEQRLCV